MTTEERLALVDADAQEAAPLENRTLEEAKAGVGAVDPDDSPAVPVSQAKMLNLPEGYEILPPALTIQSLRIYLKGIPSSRVNDLVEAIHRAWPPALYVASKVPLTPEGNINIRAVAEYWTEIRVSAAQAVLPKPENEDEEKDQAKALQAAVYTVSDVAREFNLLEEGPENEPTLLDEHLPEIAAAIWMLAGDCPQNAHWSQEKLVEFMRKNFRLADYARLARLLLEVNSVGGGYTDDLCERFIAPS